MVKSRTCRCKRRPRNHSLSSAVKLSLVVVAFDDGAVHFAHALDALMRVGVVTDHVAQTNKVCALALARVLQHGFERLEVGMNVTEDRETHWLRR